MNEYMFRFGNALFCGNPTHWIPSINTITAFDKKWYGKTDNGFYVLEIFHRLGAQFHVMHAIMTPGGPVDFKMFCNN